MKRDRFAARFAMQAHINRRCWANPAYPDIPNSRSKDHALGIAALNHAHAEIQRFRWESKATFMGRRWSRSVHYEKLAYLHRLLEHARLYDRPPLP